MCALVFIALLLASTQHSWAQKTEVEQAIDTLQNQQNTAQTLSPRVATNQMHNYSLPANTLVHAIIIKFHEGTQVRLRNNQLTALTNPRTTRESILTARQGLSAAQVTTDLQTMQQVVAQSPIVHTTESLFSQGETILDNLRATGEAQSGRELADLNNFYRLPLKQALPYARMIAIINALNTLASVEIAYAESPSAPIW